MSYTVLVALDGSLLAERALRPALDLARRREGRIVLARVFPAVTSSAPAKDLIRHESVDDERQVVEDYLKRLAKELKEEGAEVDVSIPHGYVPQKLCDLAGEHDVDLLVLTSHGRSGFERLLLGSVTEEMIRRAEVPLLILRSQPVRISQFKRILVPLDGSPLAEEAVPQACEMARLSGAVVVLCRISTTADLPDRHPARLREEKEIEAYFKTVSQTIPSDLRRQTLTREGSTARAVIYLAQHHNIDLVVMASHQRRGLSRFFWGSVAENVIRGSVCPTLLVPGRHCDD